MWQLFGAFEKSIRRGRDLIPGPLAWKSCTLTIPPRACASVLAYYLVDEVKELADVVRDGWDVWILPLEVLLVDLANALHALVDRLVVGVSASLGLLARLHQQDRVRHAEVQGLQEGGIPKN